MNSVDFCSSGMDIDANMMNKWLIFFFCIGFYIQSIEVHHRVGLYHEGMEQYQHLLNKD